MARRLGFPMEVCQAGRCMATRFVRRYPSRLPIPWSTHGNGRMAKLQAYELQDSGLDTVEANERLGFKADQRDFALPAQMLKALGVSKVRLLSNNPGKVEALERAGVKVVERVPCEVEPSPHAEEYLKTKKEKLGHLFSS